MKGKVIYCYDQSVTAEWMRTQVDRISLLSICLINPTNHVTADV